MIAEIVSQLGRQRDSEAQTGSPGLEEEEPDRPGSAQLRAAAQDVLLSEAMRLLRRSKPDQPLRPRSSPRRPERVPTPKVTPRSTPKASAEATPEGPSEREPEEYSEEFEEEEEEEDEVREMFFLSFHAEHGSTAAARRELFGGNYYTAKFV